MRKTVLFVTLLFFVSFVACGCAKTIQPPQSAESMNTAVHRIQTGWQLIEAKDYNAAIEVFEKALKKSPESSLALSGKSMALTMLGQEDEAFQAAKSAFDAAKTHTEEAKARIVHMKALAAFQPDQWFEEIRADYEAVIKTGHELSEATLLMANAFAKMKNYDKAAELYAQVVSIGGEIGKTSSKAWENMQDTRRVEVGQRVALDMAGKDTVTRGEFAAVLVEGLCLHQVITVLKDSMVEPDFVSPQEMVGKKDKSYILIPEDIESHPLKSDITAAMTLRLRGLQPLPSGEFRPDAPMTRAETAMALQDLAAVLTLAPSDNSNVPWNDSSFVDIPAGNYALDAINFCVAYDLLEPRGKGRFEPTEPLSGLEAVKSVEEIRQNIALRHEEVTGRDLNIEFSDSDWQTKLFLTILKSGMLFVL